MPVHFPVDNDLQKQYHDLNSFLFSALDEGGAPAALSSDATFMGILVRLLMLLKESSLGIP